MAKVTAPFAFQVLHADRSTVLVDDAVADREVQAGAIRFGGEEGIRDSFGVLRRIALTGDCKTGPE